jgi:PAS domain S-box-containing protein
VGSIDVAQSRANKQMPPLIHSSQTPPKVKDHIDESKDFLEELGVNSQQFKTLFENLPQGVAVYKMIYNQKGKPVNYILLESNNVYDNIHSFKHVRIGKKATEFNSKLKDDTIDWIGVYDKVATTGGPEHFETYCKPDNKWYQIYIYSPKKTFFVSVFRDITKQKKKTERELGEQKKSKEQLLFSEKKYRRLFETTQDGIMARDLHGAMIDCNQAYAKMLGYTRKELRKLSIEELLPKKWHDQRDKIVKKVLKTGHSIVFEREYRRKDGSVFPASVRTWRLNHGKGKVVGLWSIVRDIT